MFCGQCKRTSGTDRNYSLYNRCDRYGQCENCPCGLAGERNIPIISSMGTGNKLHAEMFEITDLSKTSVCPLCKVMRKELRNRGITHLKVLYSKEKPISAEGRTTEEEKGMRRTIPGSVSFVPPVAGLLIAGEVIRSLIQAE